MDCSECFLEIRPKRKKKKGDQLEATVIIQVRGSNSLNQGRGNGGVEKWSEPRGILKEELTGFIDGLEVKCK